MGNTTVILGATGRHDAPGAARADLAVRVLAGRPLIVHSIEHGRRARHATHVVVATDDAGVGEAARDSGAHVVPWPAAPGSSIEETLVSALEAAPASRGGNPSLVAILDAARPLREAGDLDRALEAVSRGVAEVVVACAPAPVGRAWRVGPGPGAVRRAAPASQGEEEAWIETGSFVVGPPGEIRAGWRRGGVGAVGVDPLAALRAHDEESFERIENELFARRRRDVLAAAEGIRLLVFDFDGVMTDNTVIVREDGVESVVCNRSDGLGLGLLKGAGLPMLVLSKEKNPVVAARCKKLGLECLQGVDDKLAALKGVLHARGLDRAQAAYVGNDANDLACMEHVGMGIGVADSHPSVRSRARFLTRLPGGQGAVREVCDWFLASRAGAAR